MKCIFLCPIKSVQWILAVAIVYTLMNNSSFAVNDRYLINKGDKLRIDVWQEENLQVDVMVSPDGMISFPLVGVVPASGKTLVELQLLMREKLSEYIPSPEVNVSLMAIEGNVIYVLGEVAHPGPYIMQNNLHIIQALSLAGGLTPFASSGNIHVVRRKADGHFESIPFDFDDVEDGDHLETNIPLKSGDTVIVP